MGAFFMVIGLAAAVVNSRHGGDRPLEALSAPQQADLTAIEALGGDYEVDEDSPGDPVVSITLAESRATDADLARLKSFPKLKGLNLSSTAVTDAGLAHLEGLGELQFLDLSNTQVTDAGLVHLRGLNKLQMLNVSGTRVTAAGLRDLQRALPRVKVGRQ
jgi:hypothetical protein